MFEYLIKSVENLIIICYLNNVSKIETLDTILQMFQQGMQSTAEKLELTLDEVTVTLTNWTIEQYGEKSIDQVLIEKIDTIYARNPTQDDIEDFLFV